MRRSSFVIIALCVFASPLCTSAASITPSVASVPNCESIGRAIAAAHGPIGTVEDRTAKSQEVGGSLPYKVLRMCLVTIPGQRLPVRVGIDGASHEFLVAMMNRMAEVRGHGIKKLDGTSYGDLAYLLPQDAGGYAIDAVVGDLGLNMAYMPNDQDIQNMAEHVIKLMR